MNAPSLPFTQVDAFTSEPFSGNPAAVLVLEAPLSPAAMQRIAAEMNLSETAFTGRTEAGGRWLRWFTPAVEVPLCGHATLATAHVLFSRGAEAPLRFESASGELTVDRDGDRIRLDFPADVPVEFAPPGELLDALGCDPGTRALKGRNVWLVLAPSAAAVRDLSPSYSALGAVDLGGALGVAVTGPGDGDVDFVSRFFCPWVGIDEDPVTGVAHTVLTPYWTGVLGARSLEARQISARGGALTVAYVGDRVHLTGSAVAVAEGRILRPS
jgi:PhzF family phenazine biosynthesis protein